MASEDPTPADLADLGACLLPGGVVYFAPGEVVPGVMWVVATRSGWVWSRQLCTVLRMRQPEPAQRALAQLVLDL